MACVAALIALAAAVEAPAREAGSFRLDERVRAAIARSEREEAPTPDATNRLELDPRAALLGQRLFFDPSLSANGKVSCASCHDPGQGFTTRDPQAKGIGATTRNAPTLLDAARRRWYGWGGRNDTLWSQAIVPLLATHEMGSSAVALARVIEADAQLREGWRELHGPRLAEGDALLAQAGKHLAAYQRLLATGPSAFDRYARALREGDADEESRYPPQAARGAALFFGKADCRSCHAGPEFTDEEFHDLGLPPAKGARRDEGRREGLRQLLADRFRADSPHSDAREGERALELAHLAPVDEDWGRFKTPSLRNATLTAPYMHTGQFATLRDVVRFYSTLEGAAARGHHGETVLRPLNLTEGEIDDLVAFIETLEGVPPPARLLRAP